MIANWDNVFVGRDALVSRLLSTDSDYLLLGARRVGKTMLLRKLEQAYTQNGRKAFYFSIQGYLSSNKVKRKLQVTFAKRDFSPLPTDETTDETGFFEYLEKLDLAQKIHKEELVFLVDEVEQITEIEKNEPGFIDKLRNHIDSLDYIRFIMAASPHFIKLIAQSNCSAFQSVMKTEIVPVFTLEEAELLINTLEPGIKGADRKGILNYTHHQAFLIKMFMSKLSRNGRLQPASRTIALQSYTANALEGIFPNYFEGLNAAQQKMVLKILKGKASFDNKDELMLVELLQYGYIRKKQDAYLVSNWFFEQWLSGKKPTDFRQTPNAQGSADSADNKERLKRYSLMAGIITGAITALVTLVKLFMGQGGD